MTGKEIDEAPNRIEVYDASGAGNPSPEFCVRIGKEWFGERRDAIERYRSMYAVWSVMDGEWTPWFDAWHSSKTAAWDYYVRIRHDGPVSSKERGRVLASARRQGVRVATREEISKETQV